MKFEIILTTDLLKKKSQDLLLLFHSLDHCSRFFFFLSSVKPETTNLIFSPFISFLFSLSSGVMAFDSILPFRCFYLYISVNGKIKKFTLARKQLGHHFSLTTCSFSAFVRVSIPTNSSKCNLSWFFNLLSILFHCFFFISRMNDCNYRSIVIHSLNEYG